MTCSMERRLEIQLKDEREAFDAVRNLLRDFYCIDTGRDEDDVISYLEGLQKEAKAVLLKADAVRPEKGKFRPITEDDLLTEMPSKKEKKT